MTPVTTVQNELNYISTVRIGDEDVDVLVRFRITEDGPKIMGNLTRTDNGRPIPSRRWKDSWRIQFGREVSGIADKLVDNLQLQWSRA